MSGKGNSINEHRDWISNQRTKLTNGQSKVILPRLAIQEIMQHKRTNSIKKKDEEVLVKSIKDLNLDSPGLRNSQECKTKTSRSIENDSAIKDEKCDVVREIKGWIKSMENANKDEGRLQDHTIPKLQKALKKWCFFIQQMFSCYQKLESSANLPMKAVLLKSTILSKKTSEPCEIQLKNQRQFYEKQMSRLSTQIKTLEEQAENNRANNFKSIEKIEELDSLFGGCLNKIKKSEQIYKDSCQSICCILIENQSFLNKLKESLTTHHESATFQERIDFQLANLREYKVKYCSSIKE